MMALGGMESGVKKERSSSMKELKMKSEKSGIVAKSISKRPRSRRTERTSIISISFSIISLPLSDTNMVNIVKNLSTVYKE